MNYLTAEQRGIIGISIIAPMGEELNLCAPLEGLPAGGLKLKIALASAIVEVDVIHPARCGRTAERVY